MSAWRGALELGGFPINVKLESRVRVTRAPSFKELAPDGRPPVRKTFDQAGAEVAVLEKGVEVGKDQFAILPAKVVDKIKGVGKDVSVQPKQFAPLSSIDLTLGLRSYAVLPDDKVPAAEQSVNQFANILDATQQAYVTQLSRGQGMDAILVVYVKDGKLWAMEMPFVDELYGAEGFEFTPDEKARKMAGALIEGTYDDEIGEFDHAAYASGFKQRRETAIAAYLEGNEIELPEAPKAAETPDLMAALEGAVKEAGKPKAKAKPKAKKPARKKVTA